MTTPTRPPPGHSTLAPEAGVLVRSVSRVAAGRGSSGDATSAVNGGAGYISEARTAGGRCRRPPAVRVDEATCGATRGDSPRAWAHVGRIAKLRSAHRNGRPVSHERARPSRVRDLCARPARIWRHSTRLPWVADANSRSKGRLDCASLDHCARTDTG